MGNWLSNLLKTYIKPNSVDRKQVMLELLAEENEQVIALAFMYAKNMHLYGVDVTKAWDSAICQSAALNEAYTRGRVDSDEEWRKHCKQLGNNASQFFVDEFIEV